MFIYVNIKKKKNSKLNISDEQIKSWSNALQQLWTLQKMELSLTTNDS